MESQTNSASTTSSFTYQDAFCDRLQNSHGACATTTESMFPRHLGLLRYLNH